MKNNQVTTQAPAVNPLVRSFFEIQFIFYFYKILRPRQIAIFCIVAT
jgi:hypothetical protein